MREDWRRGACAARRCRRWRSGPKEGLALINGTQPSTALLGLALAGAEQLARAADIAAAASASTGCRGRPSRSTRGSTPPAAFRARRTSAANLRGAARPERHQRRRMPTAGASRTPIRCAARRRCTARRATPSRSRTTCFDTEANAATDNPMVFADTGEIVSGGNFHGAPVAVAADLLCIGLAQLATISERRADRLVNPTLSGLPAFLTRHGGLQSGLMMAQVTAAALTSELKTLAHPASVDTIPTSGNKEDHVSMSMAAALKAARALELARQVRRDRAAVRVSGDRSAAPARLVRAADARARTHSRTRADARRRPPAVARYRDDCRDDRARRSRTRVRDESQLKLFLKID